MREREERDGFPERVAFVSSKTQAGKRVVEHKGERLVTHELPNPVGNHKNIFSIINMANSLQLLWLQLQRHGFIKRGHLILV